MFANATFAAIAGKRRLPTDSCQKLLAAFLTKKTNYEVAMKIKQVLESEITEIEQEEMLREDENTTWFGIIRESGELPIFQDYGGYAQIMSDITPSRTHGAQETLYPGLVSFVGQTGMLFSKKITKTIDSC